MIRLLTLLCCLLLAVIAGELLVPGEHPASGAAAAPRPNAPPAAPAPPPSAARAQWVTEVLARPLFAPTRRPAAGATISSAEASLPRLAGVIGTPEGTVAIFQPEGDGKPVLVRDGDHLGAWDVTRIEPDAVYLERGSERMVLNPRFAAGPPPAPNLPALNPPPPNLSVPAPPVVPPRR